MTNPTAESAASTTPVHLVVMCHGLWGEPKHLHTLEEQLRRSFGKRATVVRPKQRLSEGKDGGSCTPSYSKSISSTKEHDDGFGNPRTEHTASQEDLLRQNAVRSRDDADEMDVVILNTSSNRGGKTYDGIDWLAERVVREINTQVALLAEQGRRVARFSMLGYSLGGLVVRFALGLLEHQRFFARIQARQVITVATPHVGSPPGSGMFGRLVGYIGARLLSRTGEQLYGLDDGWQAIDNDDDGGGGGDEGTRAKRDPEAAARVGLLEHMAEPRSIFIRALNRFEKVYFYANAVNDMTVPFRTGCIESYDPFIEHAGLVEVDVLADAPILTSVSITSEDQRAPKSFVQRLPTLPPFFNPNRLPFSFPYNYVVVAGSPVLFPVMVATIIYRLSKDSKKSRARIEELERGWTLQQQSGNDEGESRIVRLLKDMVRTVGEDNVEEERTLLHHSTSESVGVHSADVSSTSAAKAGVANSAGQAAPWQSPWQSPDGARPSKQMCLSDAQLSIVRHLNDRTVLPRMRKVWTYYPDVTNAHAIIIARTLSVAPHRRGLPVVKHVVDNFLP